MLDVRRRHDVRGFDETWLCSGFKNHHHTTTWHIVLTRWTSLVCFCLGPKYIYSTPISIYTDSLIHKLDVWCVFFPEPWGWYDVFTTPNRFWILWCESQYDGEDRWVKRLDRVLVPSAAGGRVDLTHFALHILSLRTHTKNWLWCIFPTLFLAWDVARGKWHNTAAGCNNASISIHGDGCLLRPDCFYAPNL